jgi:mannose-6-phosphate isomerase-like protein (cupin superfamily)
MAEKSYITDIHRATRENDNFRKVLFTTELSQLVVMSIPVGDDIGEETHEGIDQILTIVEGAGETVLEGKSSPVNVGSVIVVPAGMKHNVVTKGDKPLKLYTMYTPPDHKDGTIHRTKHDAETDPNEQHDE